MSITEKDDGRYKATLVVRGFEEHVYPQSDSPTASRESFKTFLAIAANEGFKIQNMDVKSAFLQGTPLERDFLLSLQQSIKDWNCLEAQKNCIWAV